MRQKGIMGKGRVRAKSGFLSREARSGYQGQRVSENGASEKTMATESSTSARKNVRSWCEMKPRGTDLSLGAGRGAHGEGPGTWGRTRHGPAR